MRKLTMIVVALFLATSVSAQAGMVLDMSGLMTKQTDLTSEDVNEFKFHTSLLMEIVPGLYIGAQGEMEELAGLNEGGPQAIWKVPGEWKPFKDQPWTLAAELMGWTNATETGLDFSQGVVGANVLFDITPDNNTVGFIRLLWSRQESTGDMEAAEAVRRGFDVAASTPPTEIVSISEKGNSFAFGIGVRVAID